MRVTATAPMDRQQSEHRDQNYSWAALNTSEAIPKIPESYLNKASILADDVMIGMSL